MSRLSFAFLFVGIWSCCAGAGEADALNKRGKALVKDFCAACHAIGKTDRSSHVGAPPLRILERRLNLDSFAGRLRQGLTSGHQDMPTFRFTREDARAFVVYLRSIQRP
jgi:mono/diheme cytochrome c family protein